MSNKRRQFLGIAAGAIAVPATSSLVLAQGNPSRGREAPIPAQTSVPERRSAKSELTGLSALLTPEECVVVLIDHQPFQFANLHSHEPTMIINNVIGLAKFAKAFKVPVILTTVVEARGGRIIKGLQDVFPEQKPVDRTYINTWQASGGVSVEAHDMAIRRLVQAGAVPITWIALSGEWQRDWARESTIADAAKILTEHGGGSGVAFAWEMQLLGGSKP